MGSPNQKSNKHLKPKGNRNFMRFYALAFELVLANLILIIGGYYLDETLASSPLFILVGALLAMTFTIWLLLKFSR